MSARGSIARSSKRAGFWPAWNASWSPSMTAATDNSRREWQGSLGVESARGRHERDPTGTGLKILVPVVGSEVSRRAAEVALALGKAANTTVTVLSVIAPEARTARRRLTTRLQDASETAREV